MEYLIQIEGKTKEELLSEIKQICLDARREDCDVVIMGLTPTVIALRVQRHRAYESFPEK